MAEETVFKPSPGARLSRTDAQIVGEILTGMVDINGGLDAHVVLDHAKDEASPLHKFFTWDDSLAAEAFRLGEAGRLIRSVRVVIQRSPEQIPLEVRAFVRIAQEKKGHYLPVARVMNDDDMRKQLLAKALLELQAFRQRYATLSELAVLFDAMQSLPLGKTG